MDALLTLPQVAGFLAAAVLITLAPGPDNLMVLSLGMARGRKRRVSPSGSAARWAASTTRCWPRSASAR